jgi:predicted ArsR family transcriptional regulator
MAAKRGTIWPAVLKLLLKRRGNPMSANEIAAWLDWDPMMVYRTLYNLRKKNLVVSNRYKGIGRPYRWSFNWEEYG